jgi:hypothetical protein
MNQIASIKMYERMCREECKTAKDQLIMSQYWILIKKTMEGSE